jgi:hypothetical protein
MRVDSRWLRSLAFARTTMMGMTQVASAPGASRTGRLSSFRSLNIMADKRARSLDLWQEVEIRLSP